MTEAPLLEVCDLHKSFNVPVLTGVDFQVNPGEVHALMGANGAGKSTLSNIICGVIPPTEGSMTLAGEPYQPVDGNQARSLGVRLVMQEQHPIGTLTVAENLLLRQLPGHFGWLDRKALNRRAQAALQLVGLGDLAPQTPMEQLSAGQQQMVAIAAVLAEPSRLIVLDEPTAVLTEPQIECLFAQIARLKALGTSFIYISHRMDEILRIADRVTVLRDGKRIATSASQSTSVEQIIAHMTGEAVGEASAFARRARAQLAFRLVDFCRPPKLQQINLECYRGEILGLAGLMGAGRTELLRALVGADKPGPGASGQMLLGPEEQNVTFNSPHQAVRRGFCLIPEERKHQGLLLSQSIEDNFALANWQALTKGAVWVDNRALAERAEHHARQLQLKYKDLEQPVSELSGGNQQKIVIARWLFRHSDVLLFDEPTRGIDIHTKNLIYRLLDDLARAGKAIVVVSSETSELTTLCDRIAVMSNGRLAAEFERGQWHADTLMEAAFSGYRKPSSNAHSLR